MEITTIDKIPPKVRRALLRAIRNSSNKIKLIDIPSFSADTDVSNYETVEFSAVYRVSYDKETGKIYRMYEITPHW